MINFSEIDLTDLSLETTSAWPYPIKAFFCALIFSFLFLIFYFIDLSAKQDALSASYQQEEQLRAMFVTKQGESANLEIYRQQLKTLNQQLIIMVHELPNQAEIPSLLEDVSRSGLLAGLHFKSFDPQGPIQHDFYIELPIKIVVMGNYTQFGDFLGRLSNLKRIVTIENFSIEQTAKSEDASLLLPPLMMTLTAKTYQYLENQDTQNNVVKGVNNAA